MPSKEFDLDEREYQLIQAWGESLAANLQNLSSEGKRLDQQIAELTAHRDLLRRREVELHAVFATRVSGVIADHGLPTLPRVFQAKAAADGRSPRFIYEVEIDDAVATARA